MEKLFKLEILLAWSILPLSFLIAFCPESFYAILIQSFAFQILCVVFVLGILWLLRRKLIWALLAFSSAVMILSILPTFPAQSESQIFSAKKFKVAHFNVLKFNTNYQRIIEAALESDADFISFQEVNRKWADSLKQGLKEKYPFFNTIPHDNNCLGMAVFSKYPLCDLENVSITGIPNIAGRIEFGDTSIRFIASHTKSPTTSWNFRQRNEQIREIAKYLNSIDGLKIAVGDYNTVPWDGILSEFKTETQLSDSRKSLAPTYPSWLKIARIPIDYIFHCSQMQCISFSTIDNTSSDHLGVIGVYELKS